jgi:hypothetical protein
MRRDDASIRALQRRVKKLEAKMPNPQPPPGRTDLIKLMSDDHVLMDLFTNMLQLLSAPEDEHAPPPTKAMVQAAWDRYEARLAALDAGAPCQPRQPYSITT